MIGGQVFQRKYVTVSEVLDYPNSRRPMVEDCTCNPLPYIFSISYLVALVSTVCIITVILASSSSSVKLALSRPVLYSVMLLSRSLCYGETCTAYCESPDNLL